jgi:transposase-like protein
MSKRRTHSPEFTARVAMEAISGCKTIQEIAADHAIHLGLPRFRGQVNRGHAMPLRLAIDDQPNQDRAPVHAFVEAGGD